MSNSTKAFYAVAVICLTCIVVLFVNKKMSVAALEHTLAVKSLLATTSLKKPLMLTSQHQVAPSRAVIKREDDFVFCQQVRNKIPYGIRNQFSASSDVWVWASIYAPRKETITIQWLDHKNEILRSTSIDISENRTQGFRVFDAKYIRQRGIYKVYIFNAAGDLIGRKQFTVE